MPIDNQLTDFVSEENKITQDVIDNLKEPRFVTACNPIIISRIHSYCKMLLEFSKNKHDSKEIAYLINLNTGSLERVSFGNAHNVSIPSFFPLINNTNYSYLIIHNHPSNSSFSQRDVRTFISLTKVSILIVLGNKGAIYILEKKRDLSFVERFQLIKKTLQYKTNEFLLEDVIIETHKCEIIYTKI